MKETITIQKAWVERLKYYTDQVKIAHDNSGEYGDLHSTVSALLGYLESLRIIEKLEE